MGMYDTFVLRVPVQCTNCYTGAHKVFQTKDFDSSMGYFREGKPAVYHAWRKTNEDEKREEITWRQIHLRADQIFDDPFWSLCGSITDSDEIVGTIPDGVYSVYDYCQNCKKMFYIDIEIKNGVFTGIYNPQ